MSRKGRAGRADRSHGRARAQDSFAGDIPWVAPTIASAPRYESPVLRQMRADVGGWTVEILAELAPVYQAGHAAQTILDSDDPPTDAQERSRLRAAVAAGEAAKEKLVLVGMPLAKRLANEELSRRMQAGALVSLDDLLQEAFIGMLKGLLNYRADKQRGSPTNYVSAFISMEMRRGETAKMDSDFSVPVEVATRFRRIRALRARLAGELEREPTPEEISAASTDPRYVMSTMMAAKGVTRKPKHISVDEVLAERRDATRVGPLTRPGGTSEEGPDPYDSGAPVATGHTPGSDERAMDQVKQDGLASLLEATMDQMGLPAVQRDIVARHHGLAPYQEPQSPLQIGRALDVEKVKVLEVVDAFSVEMARPGGAFHQVCSTRDPDELADLDMRWVTTALGRWDEVPPARRSQPPPAVLVDEIVPIRRRRAARPQVENTTSNVLAQYQCSYDSFSYLVMYETEEDVLSTRACPRCQGTTILLRQDTGTGQ